MTADSIAGGMVVYAADIHRLAAFYSAALGLDERARDAEHVRLVGHAFEVVLLARGESGAGSAGSAGSSTGVADASPGARRGNVAIKPVFLVPSIAAAREVAVSVGGLVNAERHEWRFGAYRVCDALDPEGNVIQLRERCE